MTRTTTTKTCRPAPRPAPALVLQRQTFHTSRVLDYFSEKELTLQTGHEPDRWPEVILKELLDNALDACEEVTRLPDVVVDIGPDTLVVQDNGPGLPAAAIRGVLDFSVRVSSKDPYVSPTRGAQGNALKTVIAMPYVVSGGDAGEVAIHAKGARHDIRVVIDRITQQPALEHKVTRDGPVRTGTRVTVRWPDSASSMLEAARRRFLQLVEAYALFNPHATFTLHLRDRAGQTTTREWARTGDTCQKWVASAPTSAHWYSVDQLRALATAYIAAEGRGARPRTVREFISEFRGLAGTAKQKAILARLPALAGAHLRDLVTDGDVDRPTITTLLAAMRAESRPVKPAALGVLGEAHLTRWLQHAGARTVTYRKTAGLEDESGQPFVVETAFGVRHDDGPLRLVTGINWAPTLVNPFRALNDYGLSLDGLLQRLYLRAEDPVTFVLHLACPHLRYTDRGKSSLEAL